MKINAMVLLLGLLGIAAMSLFAAMSALPPKEVAGSGSSPVSPELFQATREHILKEEAREKQRAAVSKQQSGGPRYYMAFSTSCSPFQNWQGLAFFHFAKKVNQPGNVTRIVSGCTPAQADALRKIHAEKIAPLSPNFHMHVTPDYGVKDNTKYWNKPHGILDWLKNDLGFPDNAAKHNDDIIIVVDPDMMLLRPITHVFDDVPAGWIAEDKSNKVIHGLPFAQAYGFGNAWLRSLKGNISYVVGPDSPANDVTLEEAENYFPAGPPYLATGKDMYNIATHWVKFLPRLHELFPFFMAEMHAYSAAAAHLKLRHQLAKGFMLSDVGAMHREAFGFLENKENVTRQNACLAPIPTRELPFVMHFCQRYAVGRWFFSKYKLREDFFDCEAPLMKEPPLNVGEIYDWYIFPNGWEVKDHSRTDKQHFIIKNAWMLCIVIFTLNEVAIDLKKKHCGANANFEKTWHFHEEPLFQAMLDDPTNPFTSDDPAIKAKHGVENVTA